MAVELQPSEVLTFKRPLTRTSKEVLFVRNDTGEDLAFKVKTTAPKLYCVRPNSGFVLAGKTQEVQVMLQPFKEEPPLDQKCKDKFLVQTVPLVGDIKNMELADLWAHVESNAKGLIQQIKLRCDYVAEEAEKKIVGATPVDQHEVPVESTSSMVKPVEKLDEMAKMRLELDAYRNELETLKSRAPDATVVSPASKSNGVSLPLVILVSIISFLASFVLLKQFA